MSKEIDQLTNGDAIVIFNHHNLGTERSDSYDERDVRTAVRNFLRDKKLTPAQAIEAIRKEKAYQPKRLM